MAQERRRSQVRSLTILVTTLLFFLAQGQSLHAFLQFPFPLHLHAIVFTSRAGSSSPAGHGMYLGVHNMCPNIVRVDDMDPNNVRRQTDQPTVRPKKDKGFPTFLGLILFLYWPGSHRHIGPKQANREVRRSMFNCSNLPAEET